MSAGRDSVVVRSSESQSGGTVFDPRQRSTCPGLTKPAILSGSHNWYHAVSTGVNGYAPMDRAY